MRVVQPLEESSVTTLREAIQNHPMSRVRQRAQGILLSHRNYSIKQIADIFEVDRDTVTHWLNGWEEGGLCGLYDAPRAGRLPILNAEDLPAVKKYLEEEPRQLKQVQAQLSEAVQKTFSTATLKRYVKKNWGGCINVVEDR